MRRLLALALFALAACGPAAGPARADPLLADWAVLVVAADERAAGGKLTEGFDNARREVAQALLAKGARPENLRQLSVDPARDPTLKPGRAEPEALERALADAARQARGGCLLYFTSHGDQRGIVLGPGMLSPNGLARLTDQYCGGRPTVVVISACHSGVFIPALAGPERLVLTAARTDRTSFGCGQDDRMPYFDACMVQSFPGAPDFLALSLEARRCVAERERATGMRPPSEPQLSVDPELRATLPLMRFAG